MVGFGWTGGRNLVCSCLKRATSRSGSSMVSLPIQWWRREGVGPVASRAESGWLAPNEVVRVDLVSGKVYPIAIARAENLDCLAFLPERGFLVFSSPDQPRGPEAPKAKEPEYFLVDPASGRVQPVKGEFSPCHSLNKRPLQPTGKAGEFWATRPTEAGVELGRYRLKDFQFTPVRSYAGIRFGSSSIWVSGKSLFAVVDGNVLELPIH
jgi:hypothetical protein